MDNTSNNTKPYIYVASSWRNERQPEIVEYLRTSGFDVYDFRQPAAGESGFSWAEVDPNWKGWSVEDFRNGLHHPIAARGFRSDLDAMVRADACLLLLPCGRSAHLEAGWFAAQPDKALVILAEQPTEPELMYRIADAVEPSVSAAVAALECSLAGIDRSGKALVESQQAKKAVDALAVALRGPAAKVAVHQWPDLLAQVRHLVDTVRSTADLVEIVEVLEHEAGDWIRTGKDPSESPF